MYIINVILVQELVPIGSCRAHVAELLVKEQDREEKAQQVVQALQLLKSEMKEKERIAQKEHKKAKVRWLFSLICASCQ